VIQVTKLVTNSEVAERGVRLIVQVGGPGGLSIKYVETARFLERTVKERLRIVRGEPENAKHPTNRSAKPLGHDDVITVHVEVDAADQLSRRDGSYEREEDESLQLEREAVSH
jgi:hypothetical protein